MNLLSKLIVFAMFSIIPIGIGFIFTWFFDKEEKNNIADYIKLLIGAWIYGFISMLAFMQLIAIPMLILKLRFHILVYVFGCGIAFLWGLGLILAIKFFMKRKNDKFDFPSKISFVTIILAIIAIALVGAQARISSKYQHTDDDDARFVVLEVIAVERDEMLVRSPIDGLPMHWNSGEVKKDFTSPWPMYVAVISKISGMPPAILSHRMLPLILIVLSYMAYFILGLNLFKKDLEKTFLFLIIISVMSIFGYTSTHTVASLVLLRIWQGKAVFAGIGVPVLFSVFFEIFDKPELKMNYIILFLTAMANCLLSGGGIIISLIGIGIFGIIFGIKYRKLSGIIKIWLTCSPCLVCCVLNLFWFQVFARL